MAFASGSGEERVPSPTTPAQELAPQKGWRYYLGLFFLGLALAMPLLALLILPLDLPPEAKAGIMGVLSLGGPEVALVAAAALLGKDMLNLFKSRIFSALRRLLPTEPAPRFRYYTCLTLMVLTYVGWYVYGYFGELLPTELRGQSVLVAGDVTLVVAFLAAGPELWEKIQRVFRWEGRLRQDS